MRIVSILFPLFAITALGYLVGRRYRPDLAEANRLNMEVFTPALVFAALAGREVHPADDLPLLGATLAVLAGSGAIGWAVARWRGIDPRTLVPPMMFSNSGNLGLPLAVLAFGPDALAPAVVVFAVTNLVHFSFGIWLLDRQARLLDAWRSPSVLAAFAGVAVSLSGLGVWPPLMTAVRMVGDIAVPLMLLALGVRMAESRIGAIGFGLKGALLRPLAGTAAAWMAAHAFGLPKREQGLLLIYGALPPAVLNYMFAERYRQEPDRVASMVLIGNAIAPLVLSVALALVLR